jgi:methyl-accepting chemotaxis protein
MNLKFKFFSLSTLSILCIVTLVFQSFVTIHSLQDVASKLEAAHKAVLNQAQADRLHDAIRGDVHGGVTAQAFADQKDFSVAMNDMQEHANDYVQAIESAVSLNLPEEIHKNFIEIQSLVTIFIDKGYAVLNNIGKQEVKDDLSQFEGLFKKIDGPNDILTDQVNKLANQLKLEGENTIKYAINKFTITAIATVLFSLFVPIFIVWNIFVPQNKVINVMQQILGGDVNQEVPFLARSDELGKISQVLEKIRCSIIEKQDLEIKSKQQAEQAELDRHNAILTFVNKFETNVKAIVDTVASAVMDMDKTAKLLETNSNNTQLETKQLSTSASQTNSNVQGVSKATNEFTNAVNEISTQVTNSREYVRRAFTQTEEVSNVVTDLENKAKAINSIIDIINNITAQIDLLALNATIEAARAGDMGKGFAVVANEVKALATQTSKATEEINVQIQGIQSSTSQAVSAINNITESVKIINQNSASIASAVEEQSATTSYIAESISQVASMSNAVGLSVEKVSKSAVDSGSAASKMVLSSAELLKQTNMMQQEVNSFLASFSS